MDTTTNKVINLLTDEDRRNEKSKAEAYLNVMKQREQEWKDKVAANKAIVETEMIGDALHLHYENVK